MGQYHLVANIDRKEYIHPHRFGDGLKLMEFGLSAEGTLTGLAVLLAASNRGGARGGGDLHPWIKGAGDYGDGRHVPAPSTDPQLLMDHIVGRWAGNRIAIVGDYFERGDVPGMTTKQMENLWNDEGGWLDISGLVIEAIELDYYCCTSRHKVETHSNGHTYARATAFGSDPAHNLFINRDGSITRSALTTPKEV